MRITRLCVAELRQFRERFELAGLQAGANVFTGANEAGKSTLVRAIRAAFFERHRSTSVDDLRPYGDAAATPTIEVDFEIDGTAYRLRKSFLQKKRCELQAGDRRFEGVEAEDHLAALLGFQFAAKGASRTEHWGVPGLLWIEQGSAHLVHEAVGFAADHLRNALDRSLGEVAASGGDELVAKVRELRGELLTGKDNKPRAGYRQAIDEAATLQEQVALAGRAVQDYRDQVDQLRGLREAQRADAAAEPWKALRAQQAQAEAALRDSDDLARQRDTERERLRQTTELRQLLQQQLADAERQRAELAAREVALAAARAGHDDAADAEKLAARAAETAAERAAAGRAALALARREHDRAQLARQHDDASRRAGEAAALLARALQAQSVAATLAGEARALQLAPTDLKLLRAQQQRLQVLAAAQAAAATRLDFVLTPGTRLQLGDEALSGSGERLLVAATTLLVPGVGELRIAPGGSDLAALARERSELQDTQGALLQRLGLGSVQAAEDREQAHRQRAADAEAARQALALLVPAGLDALREEHEAAAARQATAAAVLTGFAPPPATPPPLLADAEAAQEVLNTETDRAAAALQQARQALAGATSRLEAAQREREALRSALADPQLRARLAARAAELLEAVARAAALADAVAVLESRIVAARPELLRQDIERLRRSADEAERAHRLREQQTVQLEATLAAVGAQGIEEKLAGEQARLAQLLRRRDELRRRAEALDFLLGRLDAHRQRLTRQLQAPLQKHLDHYLQLLFAGGRLDVDETLAPGALTRPGAHGMPGLQAGDFGTLSFGAQEQLGVICRLAYADLLRDAGRPTLLILDDALVHSDEPRLALMKRVLFDAATRHQLLVFSCHPARWRDLGVPLRAIESARPGSGPVG